MVVPGQRLLDSMARPRLPVALVAACALDRAIGRGGALPWRLPSDWAFFATATRAQVLVLGRHSFQELNAPLANRHTIVVSPSLAAAEATAADGADVAHVDAHTTLAVVSSLDDALALANVHAAYADVTRVFVGGGERLFGEALDRRLVESCYVTRVHKHVADGDAFLPAWTDVCPRLSFARTTATNGTRVSFTVWKRP